jgi:hypothetical protein
MPSPTAASRGAAQPLPRWQVPLIECRPMLDTRDSCYATLFSSNAGTPSITCYPRLNAKAAIVVHSEFAAKGSRQGILAGTTTYAVQCTLNVYSWHTR